MIISKRFLLRPLVSDDVNQNYLSWLNPDINNYIEYANSNVSMKALKSYISERKNRQDILFLGIFSKGGRHIGNIKYEPIDYDKKTAVMGILIGNSDWRGKGVAGEVIKASGKYLFDKYGISTILLGVSKNNKAAISAYQKIGFKVKSQDKEFIKMAWRS
jgi:[ribosomal protein S5]-alanine N-acetyltransferase